MRFVPLQHMPAALRYPERPRSEQSRFGVPCRGPRNCGPRRHFALAVLRFCGSDRGDARMADERISFARASFRTLRTPRKTLGSDSSSIVRASASGETDPHARWRSNHRKRLRRISAIRIGSCTDAILERGVPLPDATNVRGLAGQVVLPSSPGGAPGVLPFAGLFPRRVSVHF